MGVPIQLVELSDRAAWAATFFVSLFALVAVVQLRAQHVLGKLFARKVMVRHHLCIVNRFRALSRVLVVLVALGAFALQRLLHALTRACRST